MKPPEKTTYKEKTTKVYQTVRTVSKFNGGKTEVETEVKWILLTHMGVKMYNMVYNLC